MIPPWAAKYVGIPFQDGGPEPFDCYQLVRRVYRTEFNIELPSYVGAYVSAHEREEVSSLIAGHVMESPWYPVTHPRAGDGVVLRVLNRPWHVGICVSSTEFLHVSPDHDSMIERLDANRWSRRIVGFYRHEALA